MFSGIVGLLGSPLHIGRCRRFFECQVNHQVSHTPEAKNERQPTDEPNVMSNQAETHKPSIAAPLVILCDKHLDIPLCYHAATRTGQLSPI